MNDRIRAPQVRLVGSDGQQIGIVSIQDALGRAQELNLDLVEVAPQANPPVCRIMDYGKFKYERDVRQKEALGLGHAVLRATELVGDEPFSVVLADDLIEAETPCLRQLLDVYSFFCSPVLSGRWPSQPGPQPRTVSARFK